MIRVAWKVPNAREWVGGYHYFKNLLEALLALPNRRVEPVLLDGAGLPPPFDHCPVLSCPGEIQGVSLWRTRDMVGRWLLHNGGNLARLLRRSDIRLLSHANWLGVRSPVPALCWIADFQPLHLPHFFPPRELLLRRLRLAMAARHAQAVVVSSEDARRDFARFYPSQAHKSRVLHFVAYCSEPGGLPDARSVLSRLNIDEPFFHLPNQLWAHKNHDLVIEAMALLAKQGRPPLVISTGYTDDPRDPGFYQRLRQRLERVGLTERFRFLGLLPHAEVMTLMARSVAVINPSFFEGWSTSVEEAKSLGKRLLLSDLAVHREQAPGRVDFFDPHDATGLATCMRMALDGYDPDEEVRWARRAQVELPGRLRHYALAYEELVLEVVSRWKNRA